MGGIWQYPFDSRTQLEPRLWAALQQSPCDSRGYAEPYRRQAALPLAGQLLLPALYLTSMKSSSAVCAHPLSQ